MGAVISRWRVKPTTVDLLESLDKDIKDLEEFRTKNQRLLKLWVGRLLVYSSVLYLLSCVWVYLLYLPEQWIHRVAMSVPLLLFPGLVWCLWKLLIFLFSKRTERNNDKLEDLKVEKRKILEHVMETETYKNAKLILERFDPETRRKAELESTPVRPQMTPGPGQELRHRGGSGMRPPPMGTPITMTMTPAPATLGTPTGPAPLSAPGGPPERGLTAAEDSSGHQGVIRRLPQTLTYSPPIRGAHPPGPPLSRPVLPRERSAVDRVIEYLVGDGPQNRYALICQQCFSHNGMALREEFEYLAFRCAYCYVLNPARKTRPQAPRLPEFNFERRLRSDSPSLRPAPLSGADTEEHPSEVPLAAAPCSSDHGFSSLTLQPHQIPGSLSQAGIQLHQNPGSSAWAGIHLHQNPGSSSRAGLQFHQNPGTSTWADLQFHQNQDSSTWAHLQFHQNPDSSTWAHLQFHQNPDSSSWAGIQLHQIPGSHPRAGIQLHQNPGSHPRAGIQLHQNPGSSTWAGIQLHQIPGSHPRAGIQLHQNPGSHPRAGIQLHQNPGSHPRAGIQLHQNPGSSTWAGIQLHPNSGSSPWTGSPLKGQSTQPDTLVM